MVLKVQMHLTFTPDMYVMALLMQNAGRTSRLLMRTGAALLELGRAAGLLSHAGQGYLGPLVYGHTGFLRPDGQVGMYSCISADANV